MLVRQSASGRFRWRIVNALGVTTKHSNGWQNNLILNQGLDNVALYTWAQNFRYCAIGTDSTAVNASQVGLLNEISRTANVLEFEGANSTVFVSSNVWVSKRTFEFTATGSPYSFREVGWSYTGSIGDNLFSRVVLGENVDVGADENILVEYELSVTLTPDTQQSVSDQIVNLTLSGNYMLQLLGMSGVDENGDSGILSDSSGGCLEPSIAGGAFLSTSSAGLASLGSAADRSADEVYLKSVSLLSYSSGSYKRNKRASFNPAQGLNGIYSFGLGAALDSHINSGFVAVLSSPFNKLRKDTLTIYFTFMWGRS